MVRSAVRVWQRLTAWWHAVSPVIATGAQAVAYVSLVVNAYLLIEVHKDVVGHSGQLASITQAGKDEVIFAGYLAGVDNALCHALKANCPPLPTFTTTTMPAKK